MLRPGWSLAHDDVTTSHRCFASCTGFQCGSASATRSPRWHACSSNHRCLSWPRPELPGWRLPTRHRRRRQTIAFCRHSNTGRWSQTKFFWRQNIGCGSTSALEQFVVWRKTTWLGWLPLSPVVIFGVHLKHFFVGSRATDKLRPYIRYMYVRYFPTTYT